MDRSIDQKTGLLQDPCTKMMSFAHPQSNLLILDVTTLTRKEGSSAVGLNASACAVSADQFAVWEGVAAGTNGTAWISNKTFFYNMKTEISTSSYVAPRSDTVIIDTSDEKKKKRACQKYCYVIEALLAIVLATMSVYLGSRSEWTWAPRMKVPITQLLLELISILDAIGGCLVCCDCYFGYILVQLKHGHFRDTRRSLWRIQQRNVAYKKVLRQQR